MLHTGKKVRANSSDKPLSLLYYVSKNLLMLDLKSHCKLARFLLLWCAWTSQLRSVEEVPGHEYYYNELEVPCWRLGTVTGIWWRNGIVPIITISSFLLVPLLLSIISSCVTFSWNERESCKGNKKKLSSRLRWKLHIVSKAFLIHHTTRRGKRGVGESLPNTALPCGLPTSGFLGMLHQRWSYRLHTDCR